MYISEPDEHNCIYPIATDIFKYLFFGIIKCQIKRQTNRR